MAMNQAWFQNKSLCQSGKNLPAIIAPTALIAGGEGVFSLACRLSASEGLQPLGAFYVPAAELAGEASPGKDNT